MKKLTPPYNYMGGSRSLRVNKATDSDDAIPTYGEVKSLVNGSGSNEGSYLLADRTTLPATTNLTSSQKSLVRGIGFGACYFIPCKTDYDFPTNNWDDNITYCNSFNNGISGWHCPYLWEIAQAFATAAVWNNFYNVRGTYPISPNAIAGVWASNEIGSKGGYVDVRYGVVFYGDSDTKAATSYSVPVLTLSL